MSEKIFACLLRLYPSRFRTRYREEALQVYRDILRDEAGMFHRWRLFCDLLLDALVALPRAWRNTYAATSAPSPVTTAADVPSFRLLEQQPLRPASILIGSTVSFAILSLFGLMMSHPTPSRWASTSSKPSAIEAVMDRLNPAVSSGAVPSGNNDQAATASAAGDAPLLQSPTRNPATIAVDSGLRLDDAERDRVVQSTSKNLLAHYFDHEKAVRASGALLTREKDGEYRAIADGTTLAQRLTADIRSETQDPHFEVLYSRSVIPDGPRMPPPAAQEPYRRAMKQQNCTFEKVEILPHRVGYLKFNSFPDPDICGVVAHASLEQMRKANVIIIDLRDNTGGDPEMVAKMAAPLFDRPVPWYNPRAHPGASILSPEPGSGLAAKPVYILTSSLTYSGAEHFTYDLKMLKRATVVGETTGGAAHSGVFHRIDDHFGIGIPETRIANPYGGPDWSVNGVEPDVKVSAADALTKAEEMATKLRNK